MKILSALKKKKVPRDFYVSIIFKPHKAAAILFEKTQQSLVIISTKEEKLAADLDTLSGSDLVKVSDTVVSSVEGALPDGENVDKTIFSVPYPWQTDGKITRENLLKLKQICDALELKAIGFIISAEAIVNFLHKKDGAPVSAIFVEHAANKALVYIVKAGNIIEFHSSDVEEDFVGTVEKLLTQVEKVDNLPAKIVLHDYEGVESLQQEFLNHEWKKELNFLQIPQVLVLEKGFENESVINGVATQMGFDVLQNLQTGAHVVDEESDSVTDDGGGVEVASAEEFGFSQSEAPVEATETVAEEKVEVEDMSADEVQEDFVTDTGTETETQNEENPDANLIDPLINDHNQKKEYLNSEAEFHESDKIEDNEMQHTAGFTEADANVKDTRITLADKIKTMSPLVFIKKLRSGRGIFNLFKSGMNLRVGIIVFAVLSLLIGGTYVYYSYFMRAEVVIFADSTVVTKDEEVSFSTDDDTSFEDKTVKLATVTHEVDVSSERDVTGTKETGEKAKGEVVVYNKTEKPVTFEKGTEITANNLDYVLADEIKIASTSSFSTSFSSAKVKVEAAAFGKEYNLPSGTNFSVDGQSTSNYFAKNESAFSGGTKTELTVVSKKDLETLRSEAQKGTLEKAVGGASANLADGTQLINTPLESKLTGEKFSKKEGEEAKKVSLTGKVTYTFGVYSTDDLSKFVEQMADNEVPDDYGFKKDQSDISVSDLKVDEGDVTGKISVNAVFAPTIETSKILGQITGKPVSSVDTVIKGTKGVSDYTILRKNVLPLFPAYLPFNSKNIVITIKTDG